MFPLSHSSMAISLAASTAQEMCGVSSSPHGAAQPWECIKLTVACTSLSGAAVPSLPWERAVVPPGTLRCAAETGHRSGRCDGG